MALSLALVAATTGSGPAAAQQAVEPAGASKQPVACRVLEVHTDAALGATVVVFHQRDDADRARVGELLRAHDGAPTEFRTSDGGSHPATVMRLKSCFGRGLLLFRAGTATLAEKDEFLLREPAAAR
jgi:hypothetical protein